MREGLGEGWGERGRQRGREGGTSGLGDYDERRGAGFRGSIPDRFAFIVGGSSRVWVKDVIVKPERRFRNRLEDRRPAGSGFGMWRARTHRRWFCAAHRGACRRSPARGDSRCVGFVFPGCERRHPSGTPRAIPPAQYARRRGLSPRAVNTNARGPRGPSRVVCDRSETIGGRLLARRGRRSTILRVRGLSIPTPGPLARSRIASRSRCVEGDPGTSIAASPAVRA